MGMSSLIGRDTELDAVGRQFKLAAGCVTLHAQRLVARSRSRV